MFKTFNNQIAGYIILIVLLSFLSAWMFIKDISMTLGLGSLGIVVLISMLLIRLINRSNRRIDLFFDSLSHHDFTTRFPEKVSDKRLNQLYTRMNQITALFSAGQSEHKESQLYYESILRVMTHEIRNSITPITSLSADLIAHFDDSSPKDIQESLEVICQQGNTLITFLDSYHRLTHLPEPDCRQVDIRSFFVKLQRLLKAEPGNTRIVYGDIPDGNWRMDPNLIILALINLVKNALHAIDGQSGGWVKITAGTVEGHPEIQIADNGPGIPQALMSAIFTPFYSTGKEGSGIGLSIAHRIMQLHGGRLTVDSIPGVTVFTLRF